MEAKSLQARTFVSCRNGLPIDRPSVRLLRKAPWLELPRVTKGACNRSTTALTFTSGRAGSKEMDDLV